MKALKFHAVPKLCTPELTESQRETEEVYVSEQHHRVPGQRDDAMRQSHVFSTCIAQ